MKGQLGGPNRLASILKYNTIGDSEKCSLLGKYCTNNVSKTPFKCLYCVSSRPNTRCKEMNGVASCKEKNGVASCKEKNGVATGSLLNYN